MTAHVRRYGPLARALHRVAMNRFVAEASFDIGCSSARNRAHAVAEERHVFVAGLARAGTTILLRRLYASGQFTSLTYRNMPFVLMPGVWGRVTRRARRGEPLHERAHGDGIAVNVDSPEALEEVFWRVFCGAQYLAPDVLRPMVASPGVIQRYRTYVAAILDAGEGRATGRYLCKNNNHVLRLPSVAEAFPQALILVPFRDPRQQACSLLRQHRRFLEIHARDRFARDYMGWLVHHEFGADHRPFVFPRDTLERTDAFSIDYWLERWLATYGWLRNEAPPQARFVCYEEVCDVSTQAWEQLADAAGIPVEAGADEYPLESRRHTVIEACDPGLLAGADALYQQLRSDSRRLPYVRGSGG